MIHSLKIEGYRVFDRFSMDGLGQINLLVGTNNSGKTSILEALYLLAEGADPSALWRILSRRGEQLTLEPQTNPSAPRPLQIELDVCHLFHGHEIKLGSSFSLHTKNQSPPRSITFKVSEAKPQDNPQLFSIFAAEGEEALGPRLALSVSGHPTPAAPLIPLSRRGGLRNEVFQMLLNITRSSTKTETKNSQYVSTESLSANELIANWNTIVLSPEEQRVVRALQVVEPKIERIAAVGLSPTLYTGFPVRGGFKVKLREEEQPVPIGSLGDGMWRMLALAIALTRAKDSLLLIDEIDTGFHYTVMSGMWKLVAEAAKDLNVQVFATTHSSDCVRSLATICNQDHRTNSQVSIQRLQPEKGRAVRYTESEIKAAAEQNIEVR